jgi:signal recognition particle GTPase
VAFDAVSAGKARKRDVVIADTAGRLPTQLHLMEELKKIKRVITKADAGAPHQVLLVVDGNTGQNALTQVKAFDDALGLTGLIVTKLDGTAKGGVLAAIAFIGVGSWRATFRTAELCRCTSSAWARSWKTCRPSRRAPRASSRRPC